MPSALCKAWPARSERPIRSSASGSCCSNFLSRAARARCSHHTGISAPPKPAKKARLTPRPATSIASHNTNPQAAQATSAPAKVSRTPLCSTSVSSCFTRGNSARKRLRPASLLVSFLRSCIWASELARAVSASMRRARRTASPLWRLCHHTNSPSMATNTATNSDSKAKSSKRSPMAAVRRNDVRGRNNDPANAGRNFADDPEISAARRWRRNTRSRPAPRSCRFGES